MATQSGGKLSQIGAALAAAGKGESVELTDEQREVLARATVPDTLDAILAHVAATGSGVERVAEAWSDELRAAFRLQSIVDKIAKDNSLRAIQAVISQDNRLSAEEKQVLRDFGIIQSGNGSTSSKLPTGSKPRVYLASIRVEGFRGIAGGIDQRAAGLPLEPQPGLTLVYGANGSGKSTFVEALDVLLTGSTARFAGRSREWRSAWANAHSPDRGQIDVEFVVENQGHPQPDTVTRDWTATDLSAAKSESRWGSVRRESLWGPVQTIAGLDVAGAIDEFRPILGYGELGPLFDEGDSSDMAPGEVTPFAQHIWARANIQDGTTNALWQFLNDQKPYYHYSDSLDSLLSAWLGCFTFWRESESRQQDGEALRSVIGDVTGQATVRDVTGQATGRSPSGWNWEVFAEYVRTQKSGAFSIGDDIFKPNFLEVARAYGPRFSDTIRKSIAQSVSESYGRDDYPEENSYVVLDRGDRHVKAFFTYTPRLRPYAEMILDEIHSARLEQFSQRVSDFWRKIRRSSAVRFEALSLQRYRLEPREHRMPKEQGLRVSLGLTIDGDRPIERGALSQGELHSLALSVFLPTLMRLESPFGFAVIDDPVQAMDEDAVDGLAEVLRYAAEELQVIVFTHDKRLIEALRNQDIDHTLINVTRGDRSRVECEPVYNPVTQRLFDARREEGRQRGQGRLSLTHIQDVTDHCRRAIEAACMRARRQVLLSEGNSGVEIKNAMDNALAGRDITTRGLVALAIFGDFDRHGDVRDHVAEDDDKWGEWVDATLRRVNKAVHAKTARAAREALDSDLRTLIDDVERLTQKIEENCSGSDHRDV